MACHDHCAAHDCAPDAESADCRRRAGVHRRTDRYSPVRTRRPRRSRRHDRKRRGPALHAHRLERSAARRLSVRGGDREGWQASGARPQSREDPRRPDGAWRDDSDPPLPRRAWLGAAQGRNALYVRRAVRDVHGRDHLVRCRPAGLCRFGGADRRQDEPDHDFGSADVAAKAPFDPIKITGGVLADEAVPILAR